MVDIKKEELNSDILKYIDKILEILKDWDPSNDTPPGRIIFECRWLQQEVNANRLSYPDAYEHITSIRHTYVADDMLEEHYQKGIERYFGFIIDLCDNKLLTKPAYYPYTIHMLDALLYILKTSTRPLTINESFAVREIETLKDLLAQGKIEPPLMGCLLDYPNFNEMDIYEISIDDLPNGKYVYKTVANLIFEGIRPDSWLTPEDAAKDVAQYPT